MFQERTNKDLNSELGRQGRPDASYSLTKILQGKQSDPKEYNTLINPILEHAPDNDNFTRLERPGRENLPIKRQNLPEIKEEAVVRREEPVIKREEPEDFDKYGVNAVQIHDSNSQSSKGRERQPTTKSVNSKTLI